MAITPARVTCSREYPRATASVILSVCCHREEHEGEPRRQRPEVHSVQDLVVGEGQKRDRARRAAAAPALARRRERGACRWWREELCEILQKAAGTDGSTPKKSVLVGRDDGGWGW